MELLNNLMLGFGVAFTLTNLLYAFGGAVLGTLIGVLPGLGPVATIALRWRRRAWARSLPAAWAPSSSRRLRRR